MKTKTENQSILHLAKQVLGDEFLGAKAELVLKIFQTLNADGSAPCRAAAAKIRADYYRTHESKLNHHHREK